MGFQASQLDGNEDAERIDDIQALHFDCDAKDILVVILQLKQISSSSSEGNHPLEIKIPLIPLINKVDNHTMKSKVKWLQNFHEKFDKYLL